MASYANGWRRQDCLSRQAANNPWFGIASLVLVVNHGDARPASRAGDAGAAAGPRTWLQLIAEDMKTPPKAITLADDTSPADAQQPCQTFT